MASHSQLLLDAQEQLLAYRKRDGVDYRPPKPEWPSFDYPATKPPETNQQAQEEPPQAETVRAYPTILIGTLKADLAPAGRVYLLMQALDQDGRGCLDIVDVRERLTAKASSWCICSWRRLRQIFNAGEGVLWHRDHKGRIWLHGPAQVADSLDCGRLQGRAVLLPIETLLGGIQSVKAHFLAAWHAGRTDEYGDSRPISQSTIRELTGVPESTQRLYNQVAGVKAQKQIAISGMSYTADNAQDMTYEHRGAFRFVDHKGKRGKRGRSLVAWAIPSKYQASLSQAPKGRQRKTNRRITLVTNGVQGHDAEVVRLYHPDGAAAGQAYNRDPGRDHYWQHGGMLIPDASRPPKMAGPGLWSVICAQ